MKDLKIVDKKNREVKTGKEKEEMTIRSRKRA